MKMWEFAHAYRSLLALNLFKVARIDETKRMTKTKIEERKRNKPRQTREKKTVCSMGMFDCKTHTHDGNDDDMKTKLMKSYEFSLEVWAIIIPVAIAATANTTAVIVVFEFPFQFMFFGQYMHMWCVCVCVWWAHHFSSSFALYVVVKNWLFALLSQAYLEPIDLLIKPITFVISLIFFFFFPTRTHTFVPHMYCDCFGPEHRNKSGTTRKKKPSDMSFSPV